MARHRLGRSWGAIGMTGVTLAFLSSALPGNLNPAGASVRPADTSSGSGFSATQTVTRDHLVNGADQVADSRHFSVNVDQTTQLRERQEIKVTWSGAHPTGGTVADQNSELAAEQEYPVVLMECRGVDSTSVPVAQQLNPSTCWTETPQERQQSSYSNEFPPFRVDRFATVADRGSVVGEPSPLPPACDSFNSGIQHWVPFDAANGTVYPGGPLGCAGLPPEAVNYEQSLQPSNTTYGASDLQGNGSASFVVSTDLSNASLGCSNTVPCSLVVIPIMGISCDTSATGLPQADQPPASLQQSVFALCSQNGTYQPAQPSYGFQNQEAFAVSGLLWWSASNWRNRISVPLGFAPSPNACNLVSPSAPVYLYGSEMMAQATQQWAPYFCLNPKLFKIQHVQTAEPEAKNLLSQGSVEAAIQAAPPETPFTTPTVQAPIGLTAFAVTYEVDDSAGHPYVNLKLTPRLLAKLLTESYPAAPAIRDADPALFKNPLNLGVDPEFQALNPGVPPPAFYAIPAATIFTISSQSDVIRSLTSYINADPAARSWLNGSPDPWGMVVNPSYKGISLPVDSWPLLDTFNKGAIYDPSSNPCFAADPVPFLPQVAAPTSTMANVTLNMQFGVANSQVLCVNAGALNQKLAPVGRENPGQRFLIGITSLADANRYLLNTAALQTQVSASAPIKFTDSSGRTFVAPTDQSLGAAASVLSPNEGEGTWDLPYNAFQANPAAAGAYPGTLLISADIPTSGLPTADAQKYATFLDFAATTGQTPGVGQGQLPPGFLPMTTANHLGDMAAYAELAAAAIKAQNGTVPPLFPSLATKSPVGTPVPNSGSGGRAGSGSNGSVSPKGLLGASLSAGGTSMAATTATSGSSKSLKHNAGHTGLPAGIARAVAFVTAGLGSLAFGISLLVFLAASGATALVWFTRRRAQGS